MDAIMDETSDWPSLEARTRADKLVEGLCADPEMWATHGLPPEHKLARLKLEIARALDAAASDRLMVEVHGG